MKVIIPEISVYGVTLPSFEMEGSARHFKKLVKVLRKVLEKYNNAKYVISESSRTPFIRLICDEVEDYVQNNTTYSTFEYFVYTQFTCKMRDAMSDLLGSKCQSIGAYLEETAGSELSSEGIWRISKELSEIWICHIIHAINLEKLKEEDSLNALLYKVYVMGVILCCLLMTYNESYLGASVLFISSLYGIVTATEPYTGKSANESYHT